MPSPRAVLAQDIRNLVLHPVHFGNIYHNAVGLLCTRESDGIILFDPQVFRDNLPVRAVEYDPGGFDQVLAFASAKNNRDGCIIDFLLDDNAHRIVIGHDVRGGHDKVVLGRR